MSLNILDAIVGDEELTPEVTRGSSGKSSSTAARLSSIRAAAPSSSQVISPARAI